MLKAGFARTDITPPLGVSVQGYYRVRLADGVLDPLLATAVAFDDGEKKAVIMSVDVIGINQMFMAMLRPAVAEAIGTDVEGVFIACTHTHLGPGIATATGKLENPEYGQWLIKRLADTAVLAMQDLAEAKLSYTRGEVKDVAFIRRYRMKDGTTETNPGWQNPNIDHPLGEPDENSSLLIIKREGKPEIGIVNFQVHPDVISGCKLSADFPKFVRDTYEKNIPNSRCMYINGCQGDTNHIDVRLTPACGYANGYIRSQYMGKKIAFSVLANYELAQPIEGDKLGYGQKVLTVKHNKATSQEELEWGLKIAKIYYEKGGEAALPELSGMLRTTYLAKATRIERLSTEPDNKDLIVTALSVGDAVFAGFPGEPFTGIGVAVKESSPFTLTMPVCCANGYEGYYPMQSAFDEGGYEASSSRYVAGTAEKLIATSMEVLSTLK